jgi:hypothetical protein
MRYFEIVKLSPRKADTGPKEVVAHPRSGRMETDEERAKLVVSLNLVNRPSRRQRLSFRHSQ